MKTNESSEKSVSVFETIRRYGKTGNEFRSSNELAGLLDHTDFKSFSPAIEKSFKRKNWASGKSAKAEKF
ncbi:hypothetical protein OD917_05150 [Flavobacterium sp. SH_e]|uniref:hypothetical protein n=1 Tax=Flavobacterium TaxID=237 RepID=UPI0021E3D8A5|nr:hypothetical protein [Flavobacterium sp. SH_e]MCV2484297.1 hypothetical protein [Flavobacterium sp. SH_e]